MNRFPAGASLRSPLLPLIVMRSQLRVANPICGEDRKSVGRFPQGLDIVILEGIIHIQQLLEPTNRQEIQGHDSCFQSFPMFPAVKRVDLCRENQASGPLRHWRWFRHTGRSREEVMRRSCEMDTEALQVQFLHADPAHPARGTR